MIVPKESHRPGGEHSWGGRYPTGWAGYYESFPPVTDENLSSYLVSDQVEDRIAAHVYLSQHRVLLPEVWVVIEDPESPNLRRDGREPRDMDDTVRYNTWSAHENKDDADAWRAMFQAACDAQCDKHPWWGPSSRRKFSVVRAAGAPVSQLRQPGAFPRTEAFR